MYKEEWDVMEMRQTNVRDTEKISTLDYIEKTIAILQ